MSIATRAGTACFLVVGAAVAQPSPSATSLPAEPVTFEVEAPTGCSDSSSFFRAVRARTARVRESEGSPTERRFKVSLLPFSGGFEGRLSVVTAEGGGAERRIQATTCHEAVDALSLVAALAIDPEVTSASTAAPENPQTPTSALAQGAASPPPSPPPLVATPKAPAPSPRPAAPREREPPLRTSRERSPWSLAAGVSLGTDADLSRPVVFQMGALFAELARESAALFPRFRLGGRASLPASLNSRSGSARFNLLMARAEACPVAAGPFAGVELEPCLLLDAGAVLARGDDGRGAVSRTRPYFGAGALGRLRFAVGGVDLGLEVGMVRPLVRDTWSFAPNETIYASPAIFPFAALGLSLPLIKTTRSPH